MRLIDADAIQFKEMDIGYYMQPPMVVLKCDVDAAPTVDAVPVVRCRDCGYARPLCESEFKYCKYWQPHDGETTYYLDDDGFCSYGERTEDADGRTD